MFTRRHYDAFAAILGADRARLCRPKTLLDVADHECQMAAHDHIAQLLSGLFQRDNPRFNPARFHTAILREQTSQQE